MTERVGRRGLLRGLLGERAAPPTKGDGFSLESFYARRAVVDSSELPEVVVRPGLPEVETTSVGVCPPLEHLALPDDPEGQA